MKERGAKLDVNCMYCGKAFRRFRSQAEGRKSWGLCCSYECHDAIRTKLPTTNPPETFWAWLAGFIDGEGTFTSFKRKGRARPAITISSTTEYIFDDIRKTIGGGFLIIERGRKNPNWNDSYRIVLTAKEIVRWVLEHILPYLKIKHLHVPHMHTLLDNPYDISAMAALTSLNLRGQDRRRVSSGSGLSA